MPGLAQVRRLEAVSFRSWPATNTYYDGAWAIRLTAGHPSKRLNSVNPLDPADHADLEGRVMRAAERFQAFGRPLVFRQSPLAPPDLDNLLDARGWLRFDETIVMMADMEQLPLDAALDHVPIKDAGRWVDDLIEMKGATPDLKPGLSEIIGNIKTIVGLFVSESNTGLPYAAVMCVQDYDLAGVFELVTHPDFRNQGRGREMVTAALRWAKGNGAKQAWLQVVSRNEAAVSLYNSLGFNEVYRYAYRQAPKTGASE